MNFGLAIGVLRRLRNLSTEELAAKLERKSYSMSAIEAARETLTVSLASRIARTLDSDLGVLERIAVYLDSQEVRDAIKKSERPLNTIMANEAIIARIRAMIER